MVNAIIYKVKNNGLVPRFGRIKVLPDVPEDRPDIDEKGDMVTKGGIFIPKAHENSLLANKIEKQLSGKIVSIGENVESLMVGERVVYGEFAGTLRFEDEVGNINEKAGIGYRYMNEGDVYASFVDNGGK